MKISKNTFDLDTMKKSIDTPKDEGNILPDVDMSFLNKKEEYDISESRFYEILDKLDYYKMEKIYPEDYYSNPGKYSSSDGGEDPTATFPKKRVYNYKYNKETIKMLMEQDTKFIATYRYFKGKDLLAKMSFPLAVSNSESSVIYLEEEKVDELFDVITALYYDFYFDFLKEEDLMDGISMGGQVLSYASSAVSSIGSIAVLAGAAIPGIGWVAAGLGALALGVEVLSTKGKTMPKSITNIFLAVEILINFAKISSSNKKILMSGVDTFIYAQKCEYNDFKVGDKDNKFVPISKASLETILYTLLPNFRAMVKSLCRRGGGVIFNAIEEKYPQAAGKDTTNEIDFARDPMRSEEEEASRRSSETKSEGSTLDFMRGRHTSERAGGEKYDYEYSKTGFDIKLAKTSQIDNTRIYAHNAAVAQAVKSFALQFCSLHYCKYYREGIFDDDFDVSAHIPIDMKEAEINPSIRKFNAEASFTSLKAKCNRYNQGFQPAKPSREIRLDLIDESEGAYLRRYNEVFMQLNEQEQRDFGYIYKAGGVLMLKYTIKLFGDSWSYEREEQIKSIVEAHRNVKKVVDEDGFDAEVDSFSHYERHPNDKIIYLYYNAYRYTPIEKDKLIKITGDIKSYLAKKSNVPMLSEETNNLVKLKQINYI